MHDQPTLPGMKRSEPRQGYDDTARGWVGAPHSRTETSKIAAKGIIPSRLSILNRVFEFINVRGGFGATAEEIEITLRVRGNTVRPRLIELQEAGKIVKTASTRKTTSGRPARVYVSVLAAFQQREPR